MLSSLFIHLTQGLDSPAFPGWDGQPTFFKFQSEQPNTKDFLSLTALSILKLPSIELPLSLA
jgi:hypothetical protein